MAAKPGLVREADLGPLTSPVRLTNDKSPFFGPNGGMGYGTYFQREQLKEGRNIHTRANERLGLDPTLQRCPTPGPEYLVHSNALRPVSVDGRDAKRVRAAILGLQSPSDRSVVREALPSYDPQFSVVHSRLRHPRISPKVTENQEFLAAQQMRAVKKAVAEEALLLELRRAPSASSPEQSRAERVSARTKKERRKRGKPGTVNGVVLCKRQDRWGGDPTFNAEAYRTQGFCSHSSVLSSATIPTSAAVAASGSGGGGRNLSALAPQAISRRIKANTFQAAFIPAQAHRSPFARHEPYHRPQPAYYPHPITPEPTPEPTPRDEMGLLAAVEATLLQETEACVRAAVVEVAQVTAAAEDLTGGAVVNARPAALAVEIVLRSVLEISAEGEVESAVLAAIPEPEPEPEPESEPEPEPELQPEPVAKAVLSPWATRGAADIVMTRMFADHMIDQFESRHSEFEHDHHYHSLEDQKAALEAADARYILDLAAEKAQKKLAEEAAAEALIERERMRWKILEDEAWSAAREVVDGALDSGAFLAEDSILSLQEQMEELRSVGGQPPGSRPLGIPKKKEQNVRLTIAEQRGIIRTQRLRLQRNEEATREQAARLRRLEELSAALEAKEAESRARAERAVQQRADMAAKLHALEQQRVQTQAEKEEALLEAQRQLALQKEAAAREKVEEMKRAEALARQEEELERTRRIAEREAEQKAAHDARMRLEQRQREHDSHMARLSDAEQLGGVQEGDVQLPLTATASLGLTLREALGPGGASFGLFVHGFKPDSRAGDVLMVGDEVLALGPRGSRSAVRTLRQVADALALLKKRRLLVAGGELVVRVRRFDDPGYEEEEEEVGES